ncbi:MAG: NAD-dependent epimerase/dehydratase family protein [Synergistaceae bacterium]|nr:NAD-dependent epimerase/dehydratase family protein [Synergistaceae bacterium]
MVCNNPLYVDDVGYVAALPLEWEKLTGKSFLISGASGLIGSFLVDVLMTRKQGIKIHAIGRNIESANARFSDYTGDDSFKFTAFDINEPLEDFVGNYDFVLHLASNTHPRAYSADPVGTITTNIIGLNNMLKFSLEHCTERFVFASSVEVYGANRGDTEYFTEDYCGNIDISKARSGYCEAKRCGETLCQSYIQQYGLDVVIPRFSRTYGPTMKMDDTKAISQFIRKGVEHEDIVLKSEGTQLFSYSYVADAVSGLLTVMLRGETGTPCNIADSKSDITLRELAGIVAEYSGKKVIFELPDENERRGYSPASKAIMDASRIKSLGWSPRYDIKTGITRTLDIIYPFFNPRPNSKRYLRLSDKLRRTREIMLPENISTVR